MKRPFASRRPIGPFTQINEDPEPMGVEVRNGPIVTRLEATTYTGDRNDSPTVTRDHVDFVDSEMKRLVTSSDIKERLDFAGDIQEFDVFTFKTTDVTVNSYIRHPEDMISIRILDETTDVYKAAIDSHKDLTVRNYDVVSREFVEQKHPEIL